MTTAIQNLLFRTGENLHWKAEHDRLVIAKNQKAPLIFLSVVTSIRILGVPHREMKNLCNDSRHIYELEFQYMSGVVLSPFRHFSAHTG